MLRVGELATLAGLTVRTLHHYDRIGLLRPSARSDAGYRLYNREDIARLYRIQALRTFGMSLSDIGLSLDSPQGAPLTLVARQLAALDEQIAVAMDMRAKLLSMRGQLEAGSVSMSMWLAALGATKERLSTYEKYFTEDELQQLPMYHDEALGAQWDGLIEQASGLIQSQVPPDAEVAKAFALRWLDAYQRDAGGVPALMTRLNAVALLEQERVGLPAPVMQYVSAAIEALKFEVWARYLRPEVIERMRAHHAARGREWMPLVEQVHVQIACDPDARAPRSRELAQQWMALFQDMIGTDPDDIAAFRRATEQESLLSMGTGIEESMLGWLRQALAHTGALPSDSGNGATQSRSNKLRAGRHRSPC